MTARKTDPMRGTVTSFVNESNDSKNATFNQNKKDEADSSNLNQPERVGELSTIKSESRDQSSKASNVKFESESIMSKEYLNKVDDVKDISKDNIHRLNVISEHDAELNSMHNNTIHSEG